VDWIGLPQDRYSSCELDNEPSGSIKCWELPSGCTTCGLTNGTQLHRVSQLVRQFPSLLFMFEQFAIYSTGLRISVSTPWSSVHGERPSVSRGVLGNNMDINESTETLTGAGDVVSVDANTEGTRHQNKWSSRDITWGIRLYVNSRSIV
jgi:hypothetical protein